MRNVLSAVVLTVAAVVLAGAQTGAPVVHGTVKTIDTTAKTIVVTTDKGTEEVVSFTEKTVVHGTAPGATGAFHGLTEGSEVVVHATRSGAKKTALELLQEMRRAGRWNGEMRYVTKDGTSGIVDTVVVPLFDDFGRTLAALAVCRDVTDRKRLEEYRRRESNP